MKKDKVKSKKREYDTFSITMELEKPLLYNEEDFIPCKKEKSKKRKKSIKILKGILILLLISTIGFFIWLSNYYAPDKDAKLALISDSSVEVIMDKNSITFTPKDVEPSKGFIFYPDIKVDAKAYSKVCKMIAQKGYKVVIVDMPFNFPLFGKDKANEIIEKYTTIDKWIIGGDYIGGITATKYVSDNFEKINGVVLISSYPEDSYLNELDMNVLSIWGSKDGVVDFQSLIDAKQKLPNKTIYVEIEGANHSQFANYGTHKNDEDALIEESEQQQNTVNSIVDFLNSI